MFEQVCHDDDNARRNWEKVFVSKRTRQRSQIILSRLMVRTPISKLYCRECSLFSLSRQKLGNLTRLLIRHRALSGMQIYIDKRDIACIYTRKILLRRDIWYDERDHFIKFLILIGFEQETETWKIIISLIIICLIIWYWKLMTTF